MLISANQWEYIVPRMSAFGSILSPGIYSEGVRMGVLIVRFMAFAANALPYSKVYLWEERIRILPRVVNMRDIECIH